MPDGTGDNPGSLRIERRRRSGSYRCTLLLNDLQVCTTSRQVVEELGLADATVIDREELCARIHEVESECARARLLRLIEHADRTRTQLHRRLHEDGYSDGCIAVLLDRFCELGLIDDERYALAFARTKLRSGWGTRRIRQSLRQAGVPDHIAETACVQDEFATDAERALQIAQRADINTADSARRFMAKLVRRGFSYEDARRAAFSRLDSCTPDDSNRSCES